MATISITRTNGSITTSTQSLSFPTLSTTSSFSPNSTTPGDDYLRGTGADDIFVRQLSQTEQDIFDQFTGVGGDDQDVYEAIFSGTIGRTLNTTAPFIFTGYTEALFFQLVLTNPAFVPFLNSQFGLSLEVPTTLAEAISIQNLFSGAFTGVPVTTGAPVDNSGFGGDDRIFGRGGDDYIVDLLGNNLIYTKEGDDSIVLGNGNDRIYDSGGDNEIDIQGGNNYIATRDGDDIINTGAGADNINAFDGNNVIDAGDGENRVRGGNDADIVRIGIGNDFVDVLTAGLIEDAFGNPVLDSSGNAIDNVVRVTLAGLGTLDGFHNIVVDNGGSDNIRATGNSRNDQPGFPDKNFNGDDAVVSDYGFDGTNPEVLGDDTIELGGGDNFVFDYGGNNTVRTLEGIDTIFTSVGAAGNDTIDTGAGADDITPGAGADQVRGGADGDGIALEFDGDADTVIYREGDQTFSLANTDVVFGFDGFGVDKIDVSGLGLTLDNWVLLGLDPATVGDPTLQDILFAWDADLDGSFDYFTTIMADFDSTTLALESFVFADPGLII